MVANNKTQIQTMPTLIYDISGEGDEYHGHYDEDYMEQMRIFEIEAENENQANYCDCDKKIQSNYRLL